MAEKTLVLKCHTKDCCPVVKCDGDKIIITDADQHEPGTIKLTREQFNQLIVGGKSLLK